MQPENKTDYEHPCAVKRFSLLLYAREEQQ